MAVQSKEVLVDSDGSSSLEMIHVDEVDGFVRLSLSDNPGDVSELGDTESKEAKDENKPVDEGKDTDDTISTECHDDDDASYRKTAFLDDDKPLQESFIRRMYGFLTGTRTFGDVISPQFEHLRRTAGTDQIEDMERIRGAMKRIAINEPFLCRVLGYLMGDLPRESISNPALGYWLKHASPEKIKQRAEQQKLRREREQKPKPKRVGVRQVSHAEWKEAMCRHYLEVLEIRHRRRLLIGSERYSGKSGRHLEASNVDQRPLVGLDQGQRRGQRVSQFPRSVIESIPEVSEDSTSAGVRDVATQTEPETCVAA